MEWSWKAKDCVTSFQGKTATLLPKLGQTAQDRKGLGGKIEHASTMERGKVNGQVIKEQCGPGQQDARGKLPFHTHSQTWAKARTRP